MLMEFNTEIIDGFFKLSAQTMKSLKMHQRPRLIYTLYETEFQLTCSSGNQKLLVVEDSKRIPTATHGKKGESMRVVACIE
jgi:hypothetical protein